MDPIKYCSEFLATYQYKLGVGDTRTSVKVSIHLNLYPWSAANLLKSCAQGAQGDYLSLQGQGIYFGILLRRGAKRHFRAEGTQFGHHQGQIWVSLVNWVFLIFGGLAQDPPHTRICNTNCIRCSLETSRAVWMDLDRFVKSLDFSRT